MIETNSGSSRNWTFFLLVCVGVIGQLLWRVLTRAGEWPLPPYHYISMGFDLLLIIAAVGLFASLARTLPDADPKRRLLPFLLVPTLISGTAMFVIRFSSDVGWWTGHLRNWSD